MKGLQSSVIGIIGFICIYVSGYTQKSFKNSVSLGKKWGLQKFLVLSSLSSGLNEDIDAVMLQNRPFFPKLFLGIGQNMKNMAVSGVQVRRGASKDGNEIDSLKHRLSQAGTGGLVAYGFMNCVYYTITTTFVWFSLSREAITNAAAGLTFASKLRESASRLPKTMAVVWAGSQVTKLPRLAGSLIISPFATRLIEKIERTFSISHKAAVALCSCTLLGITALFYVAIVFTSALIV